MKEEIITTGLYLGCSHRYPIYTTIKNKGNGHKTLENVIKEILISDLKILDEKQYVSSTKKRDESQDLKVKITIEIL